VVNPQNEDFNNLLCIDKDIYFLPSDKIKISQSIFPIGWSFSGRELG
jgi:hypothetical protein